MKTITCPICHESFEKTHNRQVYCSDACRKEGYRIKTVLAMRAYRRRLKYERGPPKCKWCGEYFIKQHNRQRYCSEICEEYGREFDTMLRLRSFHAKYGYSESLGTGSLGPHRHKDFTEEYEAVQREMRRLGLR